MIIRPDSPEAELVEYVIDMDTGTVLKGVVEVDTEKCEAIVFVPDDRGGFEIESVNRVRVSWSSK